MVKECVHALGLIALLIAGVGGAILAAGCSEQETIPAANPFPGTWLSYGNVGDYNATILFTFLENRTGRYDLAVTDTQPPFIQSMEFSWESEENQLFIGSDTEKQHLDIRYYINPERLVVVADAESGIFVGDDFVAGPFAWEFHRIPST